MRGFFKFWLSWRLADLGLFAVIAVGVIVLCAIFVGIAYFPSTNNWKEFGMKAEALCQKLGVDYYIKDSLRKEMEK